MSSTPSEARFYTRVGRHNKARCTLCPHNCLISSGDLGFCSVRQNQNGILYSLNYGAVSSQTVEPIETILSNFYPGSLSLSLGSIGCNLECIGCQNWQAAQSIKKGLRVPYTIHTPEQIVNTAGKYKCKSIAFKFNEPIVWYEFIEDVADARPSEEMNIVLFTNGFINLDALENITPKIAAVNLDVKFFSERKYQEHCGTKALKNVQQTAKLLNETGTHLELTNLLIPDENTSLSDIRLLCEWVVETLGHDVPLHFAAFMPDHKLKTLPPTPTTQLVSARELAKKIGLRYVYTRNISGLDGENTYCHACQKMVIQRIGSKLVSTNIADGNTCMYCGEKLKIRGSIEKQSPIWL